MKIKKKQECVKLYYPRKIQKSTSRYLCSRYQELTILLMGMVDENPFWRGFYLQRNKHEVTNVDSLIKSAENVEVC